MAAPPSSAVRKLARDYVGAIQAHDGNRLCQMFSSSLRRKLEAARFVRAGCGKTVSALIGYVEDSGTPVWKGVRLDSIDDIEDRDGGATVTFGVVHRIAEYDAALRRDIVHPVRTEDRLELVSEGGSWRIAHPGGTLLWAGFWAGVDPPRPARNDTPEDAVRDYLLGLSGGAVDLCPILPKTIQCRRGLPRWSADDPSPLWQSAAIRGISARGDGNRAVVATTILETDVQGTPGHERLTRRIAHGDITLRRVGRGWVVEADDPISRHAYGLPPAPAAASEAASAAPLPEDVHPQAIVAARGSDSLMFFSKGSSRAILATRVHAARMSPDARVVLGRRSSEVLQFAPDASTGGAVVAWIDAGALMVRRIGPSGAPLGSARAVGTVTTGESGTTAPNLATLAVSRDGHILLGWTVQEVSSEPRTDGVIVDPSLRHASKPRPIANEAGYGLAMTPGAGGWIAAQLVADQPDPGQTMPPQIDVYPVALHRDRHADGPSWSGVQDEGGLGAPALASTDRGALLVYAHGDRPAEVLAQPLTAGGDAIGSPVVVGRLPTVAAREVSVHAFTRAGGYRVVWTFRGNRRTSAGLAFVDIGPRADRRGGVHSIPLPFGDLVQVATPRLMLHTRVTTSRDGRVRSTVRLTTLP